MRIAVAVSGGTDSLAALVLLREEGLEVLALHGRFLPPGPRPDPAQALGRICADLGVELVCLDLRQAFHQAVIEPFMAACMNGLTPNPCALCNRAVKFGLLLDQALAMGADALATGHYARLEDMAAGPILRRGLDQDKDQSYFLSLVPFERLARACFPLGRLSKREARQTLAGRGISPPLPVESREICFAPGDDYRALLESRARAGRLDLPGAGPIVLLGPDGREPPREIGRHQGLWRYTLGQRRGIGVAHAEPLYVVDKDFGRNALVVAGASQAVARGCRAGQVNLLVLPQAWPETILAQTRFRQRARPARARLEGDALTVIFNEPCGLPAPGQVAALYSPDGTVLAGGVIQDVIQDHGREAL